MLGQDHSIEDLPLCRPSFQRSATRQPCLGTLHASFGIALDHLLGFWSRLPSAFPLAVVHLLSVHRGRDLLGLDVWFSVPLTTTNFSLRFVTSFPETYPPRSFCCTGVLPKFFLIFISWS